MSEIAIVGGGIAGLAAAHELAHRGVPFVLLEAGARWGGVIRTEAADGFLMEAGPDAILAQKPEGLALCREVGLEERIVPTNPHPRTVFVLHRGRLHPLPEGMMLAVPTRVGPVLRSRLFSWPGKARMGLEAVVPRRRERGDESIASFLRRRFGQESVDLLGEPLLAGIHAGDPERLSIRSTFPRFVALEEQGSLIRGLRAAAAPGPLPTAFFSLRGGLGELVDAIVARLPPAQMHTNARVSGVERAPGGFVLQGDGRTWRARAVILATPAPAAAALLSPVLPSAAETLRKIAFASTATVALGYARDQVAHPLDGYGLVVPKTEGLRSAACTFFSTKFPGRAPEGHVLLRAFVGGVRDPGVLSLDDRALAGLVESEMGPILGLRGSPVLTRVWRWPNATPQMEVGHGDRIAALEAILGQIPGLLLTGSGLRGTGLPDTIADARAAAGQAAALMR